MKKLLPLLSIFLFSCTGCMQTQAPYEYVQGPGGQQMVACYDNSGTRFLMDYLMFQSLMGNGGYGSVMGYYRQYPTRVTVWNNSYNSWHSFNGRSYSSSSYRGYNRPSSAGSSYRSTTAPPSSYRSTTRPAGSSSMAPPASRPSTWRSGGSSSYKPSSSSGSYRSTSPARSSGSTYRSSSSSSSRRH